MVVVLFAFSCFFFLGGGEEGLCEHSSIGMRADSVVGFQKKKNVIWVCESLCRNPLFESMRAISPVILNPLPSGFAGSACRKMAADCSLHATAEERK